jgi:hypothetical protein
MISPKGDYPPTMLLRKSTLAIILIGGAIAVHASIFIIGGIFAHSINELAVEYLHPIFGPISKAVLEILPIAPVFFWGVLLGSPAFVVTRLGLLIWTVRTSETYDFSPALLSFMIGLLSLPVATLLLGLVVGGGSILFGALVSFGFAIGMTLPVSIAMPFVVPMYIRKGNKKNILTYVFAVALCVGMELLWLAFLESSLGSQSL